MPNQMAQASSSSRTFLKDLPPIHASLPSAFAHFRGGGEAGVVTPETEGNGQLFLVVEALGDLML